VREIKIVTLLCALCLFGVSRVAAQECRSLQNTTLDELVTYLDGILPNDGNAECVTFAIKRLNDKRYEPAVPVLAKLLDFRRPPNSHEKNHIMLRPPSIDEMYPAANALEEIGPGSLRAVLDVIKSSPSSTARENAVSVWMEIYKYKPAKGVTLLRQEAVGTDDPVAKENLRSALFRAPTWCNPQDKARCKAAAVIPKR
jgi:hypothetical protein